MFVKRAAVTLTVGPLLLVLVHIGGWAYFWPFIIVLSVAAYEYSKILAHLGWHVPISILLPIVLLQWFNAQYAFFEVNSIVLAIGFLSIMIYALWLYEVKSEHSSLSSWFALLAGTVLIGWLGSHFFWIRRMETMAWQWTTLTFISTWIADSGAYLVGRFLAGKFVLGKHQMTPRLSPNKTYEGLFGGLILATAVSTIVAPFLNIPVGYGILLGVLVSIVGPLGDLSISLIKREAGVKDSGKLFPGHGGALDRIDSLVWSTVVGYYLAIFLF